jgi:glycosyltransferase involved in cell wall biosynthesis
MRGCPSESPEDLKRRDAPGAMPDLGSRQFADIVLLSTADWHNPFWTNKQHVAVELARRGQRILYVDSLGLRRPSASRQDLARILRRALDGLRPPRLVRERLWIWSPMVIPLQSHPLARFLNRLWLTAGLRLWSRWLGLRRDLLWTYNPMATCLFPLKSFRKVVYHCVDEISAQPGMPVREIVAAEAQLLATADLCFVTAEHLLATRRPHNPHTYYFPNVADFNHFAKARARDTVVPADLARLPAPRIGFVGAISAYKLDLALLRRLAQSHPHWSVVLIGKIGEGEPQTNIDALRGLPNLHLLGPRAAAELPAYLKGFDVALLPSAINDYTRGMFPLKFFEYLAAGCPVVSTALPALRAHAQLVCLAESHQEFIAAVERSLRGEAAPLSARLSAARQHTYELRTARMMELVEAQ